jgi:hemolysin III
LATKINETKIVPDILSIFADVIKTVFMDNFYTKKEEMLNVFSHVIGVLGGCVVGVCFVNKSLAIGLDLWGMISIGLYLFGMLGSYAASVAYHACPSNSVWKYRLRKLDHAAIYWHIAGSYSPIMLIAMRNVDFWGWGIFLFSWLCALIGTIVSFRRLKKHSNVETICFVLMGLTILVAMKQFWEAVDLRIFLWVVGEGVAYIIGALFYSFHKVKYIHAIFHLFVLLGSFCHMMAVWYILQFV